MYDLGWKEDTFYTEYMQSYGCDSETFQEVFKRLSDKIKEAEDSGWKDVSIVFNSTLEPYEDCMPGNVEVEIRGLRKCTDKELKEFKNNLRIEEESKKFGLTSYEYRMMEAIQSKMKKYK